MARTSKLTKSEKATLTRVEKRLKKKLKKQTTDGLATIFKELRCSGIAREIKAGRRVVAQVEYGIKHCVHDRLGPRINVETRKVTPQTANAKRIENRFVVLANNLLKSGGFRPMRSSLIADMRRSDRAWIKKMRKRR